MANKGSTTIKADSILLSDLFRRGRYEVPWHQRYYDWKVSDVRALLEDIHGAIREERECYFMGAIILIDSNSNIWQINDGQQRMITISLICAVLCRVFANNIGESQREGSALRILFDLDGNGTWSLDDADHYKPRILPPENDGTRYRQMIRGNTIGSNGALTNAWKEIEKYFSPMSIEQCGEFFDFLLGSLEVACLKVPPSIDPNTVFETINCRGKELEDLDLIRNYVYSCFNVDGSSEIRKSVHENLERIRVYFRSVDKASEYMRCYLQCRFGILRKDHFYRDVREQIRKKVGSGDVSNYVHDLTDSVSSRDALCLFQIMTAANPDIEFINIFRRDSGTVNARRNISTYLRELKDYKVTQPLVFAILEKYTQEVDVQKKKKVARIANKNLSRLATFVLRTAFTAPKFEPSHFETEFSNYAKRIMASPDIPDADFAAFLRDCDRSEFGILDNTKFRSAISVGRLSGTKRIRAFLFGINETLQSDAVLLNAGQCTVEHILPKSDSHWEAWLGFDDVDNTDWIHRIGNLTLMASADNKPGAKFNGNFQKKKEMYRDSGILLTKMLDEYSNWDPGTIEARQEDMAKLAVKTWSFKNA